MLASVFLANMTVLYTTVLKVKWRFIQDHYIHQAPMFEYVNKDTLPYVCSHTSVQWLDRDTYVLCMYYFVEILLIWFQLEILIFEHRNNASVVMFVTIQSFYFKK